MQVDLKERIYLRIIPTELKEIETGLYSVVFALGSLVAGLEEFSKRILQSFWM